MSRQPWRANSVQPGPPAYRDHVYRSADDRLDLYARVYEADGPPLLLMHGLTRNSADFEGLAAHLAGRYRLIVPDQRGRGRSDHDPEPDHYTPAVYVEDMFALIDGLGLDRLGLIGTSMGGLMAMMMAAAQPERFASLLLNDIGPVVEAKGLARIQSYVGDREPFASWQQAAEHSAAVHGEAMAGFGPDDWMAFARRTGVERPDGKIEMAYDPAIAQGLSGSEPAIAPPDLWSVWDALAGIPALVLRGALSDIVSPATVAEMKRRHPERFHQVDIPLRGHAPMLDEPEALAAIDRFLGEQLR